MSITEVFQIGQTFPWSQCRWACCQLLAIGPDAPNGSDEQWRKSRTGDCQMSGIIDWRLATRKVRRSSNQMSGIIDWYLERCEVSVVRTRLAITS